MILFVHLYIISNALLITIFSERNDEVSKQSVILFYLALANKVVTQPRILYSIRSALCHFPANIGHMSLENISLASQCVTLGHSDMNALTADVHEKKLMFADNAAQLIYSMPLNEQRSRAEILTRIVGSVAGNN